MKSEDIICLPNQNLRQRSKRVGVIDDNIKKLIADMESATLDWEDKREHELGVALAAIQIDQAKRVVIIRNNFEDKTDRTFQILINPKITKYEGPIEEDFEGCLSIKDVYGKVPRHSKVKVSALNEKGQAIRLTAEGFLARVLQHEVDHTNGIVFIDHIKDSEDGFFKLRPDGSLKPLNYQKDIKDSTVLWSSN